MKVDGVPLRMFVGRPERLRFEMNDGAVVSGRVLSVNRTLTKVVDAIELEPAAGVRSDLSIARKHVSEIRVLRQ